MTAARVVTPSAVLEPGWVAVDGARVVAVGAGPAASTYAFPTGTLVPGFVDLHVHGGGGADFASGDADAVRLAVAAHRRHGTTTTLASLVSAELDVLQRSVSALAELVEDGLLAGIHVEGPWLAPDYRGAHDPRVLRTPTRPDVERLLRAGRGTIRMVTLAPELDGGLDAIHTVRDAGALAAVGHTAASYETALAALGAGATVGTHLFNAMRGLHHRDPGPAVALLGDERCAVELIADGVHLHPAVLRHAVASAGAGRWLLVTDAMAAAGAADPAGVRRLGREAVTVRDGVARLASTGALAGSTLTMDAAVRHAVTAGGVPLADAVAAATATPAALLGRDDIGALAVGRRADMVVLDEELRPAAVMAAGRWTAEHAGHR